MEQGKCCPPQMRDLGLLALRIALGVVFIKHGWDKWQDIDATAAFFQNLNIPLATAAAYVVATVELVGGLMVLLGIYASEAAKFLATVMVVALLVAHTKMPYGAAELPIMLLGASLAIAGAGAGKWRAVQKECCYEGKMKKS